MTENVGFEQNVLQLDYRDENGIITVTPRNQDRFCIKIDKAIAALEGSQRTDRIRKQLNLLLNKIAGWLVTQPKVAHAYLTYRDHRHLFVAIKDTPAYDSDFEDDISDLDLAIARDVDLDMLKVDCMSLPTANPDALASFFNEDYTLGFAHVISSRPHHAGK